MGFLTLSYFKLAYMAFPVPYRGPVAPYNNLPINSQYFQPSNFTISGVTRGEETTVTTSVAHNFVIGQLVRMTIPPTFGIRQLNGQQAYVLSIPSTTQVLLNISSAQADAYVASSATTKAQIKAIGNDNYGAINASGPSAVAISPPGAFLNISP